MRVKPKEILRSIIRLLGFDLHRISTSTNSNFQLLKSLERFSVDFVFDIGANTGQFALELRSVGFKGRIVSFEPLPDAYQKLALVATRDPRWDVCQSAIGDVDGEAEINIAGNSVSSSILPMLAAHSRAAANSAYVGKVKVPVARLDSIINEYLAGSEKYFLKIDTQGFEWQVLDGACEALANAQGVLCELSLLPLYEGQHLWLEIMERLKRAGFCLWAIQTGFTDPHTGRTLQVDAIFFRVADTAAAI